MERPTGAKRGPYAKTQERRARISLAALDLVVELGQDAVTVARVAERAGLTEATVTYHCPTRDHLFIAALNQADEDNRAFFSSGTLDNHSPESVLAMPASAASGHPNRLRLYTSQASNAGDHSHPAHEWFRRHNAAARSYFAELLVRSQAAGEAHPDVDPERFARQMVAVWDGLQMQCLSDPSFDLAAEVLEAFRGLARVDVVAARKAIERFASAL